MNTTDQVAQLLPNLRVDRGPDAKGEYVAWCPLHPDGQGKPPHSPNLHVSERGWYCHVCKRGGSLRQLADELGIPMEPRTQSRVVATYDYKDEGGKLLFQVQRLDPKGFRQRRPDGKGGWAYSLNGTRRVIYRLPEIIANPGKPVWIVEGEKDADRLAREGLVATTCPMGAGKWQPRYSEWLRDRDVVIVPDNDEPGARHADAVASSLTGLAGSIKVLRLPGLAPKGDASDWLGAGKSVADLQSLADETPLWSPLPSGIEGTPSPRTTVLEAPDDPHRLARVYLEQQGRDLHGRLTLRYWRDQWWRWDGCRFHLLERADLRAQVTAVVKAEFDRLASESSAGETARKITSHLVTNVLQALTGETLLPAEIEYNTWIGPEARGVRYLAMANGLLDLEGLVAGTVVEPTPATPEWFSPIYLPYAYDSLAECPKWIAFLGEVLENDADRIGLLQEWFGYCLTPDTSHQKFLVMEGEGANGKSVVCDALASLLGHDNVSHVPLEMFGARFQLTNTLGKLANIAPEVGELDKAAEGFLKAFTSGDRMYFDRKGVSGISAYPTARLVLATNNRPRFTDRSGGLWRRMILLPFRITITETKQNPHLAEELRTELPAIFCWAVAGLHRLRQSRRFTIPTVCRESLDEYRLESNPARGFLLECCQMKIGARTPCAAVYMRYMEWSKANGYMSLGERMFGREVTRAFPEVIRRRQGSDGNREYVYEGLAMPLRTATSYTS